MKKIILNPKVYFAVIYCLLFLMFISYAFALYRFYSVFLDATFILLIIWFAITAYKNFFRDRILIIFILILIPFLGALIGFNIDMFENNFAEYGALISIILIIYISYGSNIGLDEIKHFNKLYFFLPFILLFGLFFDFAITSHGELKFGFENQNSFALYILIVFMNNVLCLFLEKKTVFRVIGGISLLLSFVFLYFTGSRTSFIIATMFGVLAVFVLLRKNINKVVFQSMIFIAMLFPIIFPIVYMVAWNLLGSSNISFLGRTVFTNRELLWIEVPNNLPLFLSSNYLNMDDFLYTSQGGHNIYFSFVWGYGITSFLIFTGYFLTMISKKICSNNKHINKISIIAFALLFLHGSFEDTFYRNIWVIVFGFLFFMMSTKDETNKEVMFGEKEVAF